MIISILKLTYTPTGLVVRSLMEKHYREGGNQAFITLEGDSHRTLAGTPERGPERHLTEKNTEVVIAKYIFFFLLFYERLQRLVYA